MDPSQYADYEPDITEDEDEDNDLIINPVTLSNETSTSGIPMVPRETEEPIKAIGDIDMPFEPENIQLNTILARSIEERDPEEIIFEGTGKVVDRQVQDTGEIIVHFEDGLYRQMSTEDVYNHMSQECKSEEIKEWTSHKYSEETGKLYITLKWKDGHESWINADIIRRDDPIQLARFIYNHPIERLQSGYWND